MYFGELLGWVNKQKEDLQKGLVEALWVILTLSVICYDLNKLIYQGQHIKYSYRTFCLSNALFYGAELSGVHWI